VSTELSGVDHVAGEVQGQQHPALRQALRAVVTAGAGQELQARPGPLVPAPGEVPHRVAREHRLAYEIVHRAGRIVSTGPPRDRPPPRPAVTHIQSGPARIDVRRHEKLLPAALMRPHGPGVSGFDYLPDLGFV
jgi:hypothetical protein